MAPNIFAYSSYRPYLKDRLELFGPKSGLKRRAAQFLGVHTTFVSQVVLAKADLSLDQAERMNAFLKHSEDEGDYFIDLLIQDRASDSGLRKRFAAKVRRKQTERTLIQKRIGETKELNADAQAKFYSSHIYGLLHVLTSIPRYRTQDALAEVSGHSLEEVREAVQFLLSIGVLRRENDRLVPGETHVHLARQSPHIRQHHSNWRMATLQKMGLSPAASDLHYSLTFTCSEEDAAKIRESLLHHLESITKTIKGSEEEHAFVYCFDFFKWI